MSVRSTKLACPKWLWKSSWNHGPAGYIPPFWTIKPWCLYLFSFFFSLFSKIRSRIYEWSFLCCVWISVSDIGNWGRKRAHELLKVIQVWQHVGKREHISRLRLMLSTGPCHFPKLGLISSTVSVTMGRKRFQKGDYFSLVPLKLALWVQSPDCEHLQCFAASMVKMLFASRLFQQKKKRLALLEKSILGKWITPTWP